MKEIDSDLENLEKNGQTDYSFFFFFLLNKIEHKFLSKKNKTYYRCY